MSIPGKRVLTSEQMAGYEELGFVHSVPILTPEEVRYYRDHVEKTWSALGTCHVHDGLHLFFVGPGIWPRILAYWTAWKICSARSSSESSLRSFQSAQHAVQCTRKAIRNLPMPECGLKFDIIIAFSGFTDVHPVEMVELVYDLRSMLTPQGVLAFTFMDPSYDRSLNDPSLRPDTGVQEMLRRFYDNLSGNSSAKLSRIQGQHSGTSH